MEKVGIYHLLAGAHVQADLTHPPDEKGRRPSKMFKAGEKVLSKTDLAARFGHQKFRFAGFTHIHIPKHGEEPKPLPADLDENTKLPPVPNAPSKLDLASRPDGNHNAEAEAAAHELTDVDHGEKLTEQEKRDKEAARKRLNSMNISELREMAEAEGIDLSGASNKHQIVEKMLGVENDDE